MIILGIDPSTTATGLFLIRADIQGYTMMDGAAAVTKASEERIARIRDIAQMAKSWLSGHPCVDLVGWERPYNPENRTTATYDALMMVCGALLSLDCLESAAHHSVEANTAKAVYGGGGLVREKAKAAAILWARAEFGLTSSDTVEHVADAAAVAVATWQAWRTEQWERSQGVLFGK